MSESPKTSSIAPKDGTDLLQRAALAGALAFTMIAGAFAATGNAFYLGRGQYAELDHGGNRPERVTGQGLHIANPWRTYNIAKWNTGKETITLTEPEATVNMDVAFSAPERTEPVFGSAMGLAEIRLQESFKKNAGIYADTKQVCTVLAQGVEEGLDGYLRAPKVTGCRIKLTPSV